MIGKKKFFKLTFTCEVTPAIPTSDDGMLVQVGNVNRMEGSSSVTAGNLGNTERVLKDGDMPDGDACRPDGTLKDASEIEWPNSLSDLPEKSNNEYFFINLKRGLPDGSDEEESSSTNDEHPKTKVS